MTIYTVCLGVTLAIDGKSKEEAIEKARAELQGYLDGGDGNKRMAAKDFDLYDVSELYVKDNTVIFK